MRVETQQPGEVALLLGDRVIASARTTELELDVPHCPSTKEVEHASAHYRGSNDHVFPTCFVYSPDRKQDGLCIFPGPIRNGHMVAPIGFPMVRLPMDRIVQTNVLCGRH